MTSRSKEKVASVFHRLFRSSREKSKDVEVERSGQTHQGSPSRRLLRGHGVVSPAELGGGGESGGAAGAGLQQQPPGGGGGGSPGGGKLASLFKRKPQQPASQSSPSGEMGVAEMGLGKSVRTRRLMKELNDIQKSQSKDSPFSVELINDNLYDWHIRLYSIDSESELAGDMREIGLRHISLQLTFPENFPFVPPFMRVMAPRIEKGFVMEGGAICMELLTPRGWASAYTVEAIVMQFAASIVKGQGRISKKGKASAHKEFNRRSAEESFRSLVKTHDKYGWVTPPLADG